MLLKHAEDICACNRCGLELYVADGLRPTPPCPKCRVLPEAKFLASQKDVEAQRPPLYLIGVTRAHPGAGHDPEGELVVADGGEPAQAGS